MICDDDYFWWPNDKDHIRHAYRGKRQNHSAGDELPTLCYQPGKLSGEKYSEFWRECMKCWEAAKSLQNRDPAMAAGLSSLPEG
jgi:hypothetical protein